MEISNAVGGLLARLGGLLDALGADAVRLGPLGGRLRQIKGRLGALLGLSEAVLEAIFEPPEAVSVARSRNCMFTAVWRRLPPTSAGFCRPSARGRGQIWRGPPQTPLGDTKREPLRKVGEKAAAGPLASNQGMGAAASRKDH